jgi:F-box protein 21
LTNKCRSAEDKSVRYVAQENIVACLEAPTEELTALAGRYFKRWDDEDKIFVSNIREEYPHD